MNDGRDGAAVKERSGSRLQESAEVYISQDEVSVLAMKAGIAHKNSVQLIYK
jgi:hypothetical protein